MDIKEIEQASPGLFLALAGHDAQKALFKRYVNSIVIELADYCNRVCDYCPVSLIDRRSAVNRMDTDHFAKILEDLGDIDYDRDICLNLFNEPLADDGIYDSVRALKKAAPNASVWFSSNGDYVKKSTLDQLADAGLWRLVVTLHTEPGQDYDDLERLSRYSQFSARTGINLTFKKYKPGQKIVATGAYKGIKLSVKAANFADNGENRGGLMTDIPVDHLRTEPCDRPFDDLTISWNGNVYPCCMFFADSKEHDDFIVGNVGDADSLFALYTSQLMASFRKDLFSHGPKMSPCDTCTEYCTDEGPEHERARAARLGQVPAAD